ncbi:hypothetical protein ACO0QE_003576 [Hanseniaspora vineae]
MKAVSYTIVVCFSLLNICFAELKSIFGEANSTHDSGLSTINSTNTSHLAFGKPKIIKFTEYSLSVALEYVYKKYPELETAGPLLPDDYVHKEQYVVFSPMGLF